MNTATHCLVTASLRPVIVAAGTEEQMGRELLIQMNKYGVNTEIMTYTRAAACATDPWGVLEA